MLKDYLAERGLSIYAVSGRSGIPYSTLNDLANGKVDIDNCKVHLIRRLADALGLTLDAVIDICSGDAPEIETKYGISISPRVRNKVYYAEFFYQGEPVSLELCRVREETRYYIEEIARWRAEAYIRRRRMEAF